MQIRLICILKGDFSRKLHCPFLYSCFAPSLLLPYSSNSVAAVSLTTQVFVMVFPPQTVSFPSNHALTMLFSPPQTPESTHTRVRGGGPSSLLRFVFSSADSCASLHSVPGCTETGQKCGMKKTFMCILWGKKLIWRGGAGN